MSIPHVAIIGGGFAGLSAARTLARHHNRLRVTLINRYPDTHSRPLLPDVAVGSLPERFITTPLASLGRRWHFTFIQHEVTRVDFDSRRIELAAHDDIPYDYLIVATGSQTNFHGDQQARAHSYRLDNAVDALAIARDLERYTNVVVSGGGYTGVEIATHVHRATRARTRPADISIVEMADTILAPLQDWMRDYTSDNLRRLGITVKTGTTVESVEPNRLSLSDGTTLDQACLIWTAGMKVQSLLADWDVERGSQGRLKVQGDLRFRPEAFAIGDAACFQHDSSCARMAVQAALDQGTRAAKNIVHLIRGEPTRPFKLVDPGLIVPMANWRSCGIALGRRVTGVTATALHYIMSAYRTYQPTNAAAILTYALRTSRPR
jgi:NADH dehydrogenase